MKIIDKNGRLFGKISVIDLLAVLVVAVLAFALHTKHNELEITNTSTTDTVITYQVRVEGAYDYVADAIRIGDHLQEEGRSTGGDLGKIVDVQRAPGTRMTALNDGTYRAVPVEDGVNLILTVEGKGIVSDGRVLLNRIYDLGVNSARSYNTPYTQFTGTVLSINY